MTGQINDQFLYEGEVFALAGVNGSELFNPVTYDIKTIPASTACWRGYQLYYTIRDDKLVIDSIYLRTKEPKPINGIQPLAKEELTSKDEETKYKFFFFNYCYSKIFLELDFTGTILIAKDFIESMYVHMGFQRPIAYKTVIELTIEKGKIIEISDKSELMAKRRKGNPSEGSKPQSPAKEDISEWVEETFSLEYKDEEKK